MASEASLARLRAATMRPLPSDVNLNNGSGDLLESMGSTLNSDNDREPQFSLNDSYTRNNGSYKRLIP